MKNQAQSKTQAYTAQNYEHLLGTPGFSDKLLTTHFKLYEGYVTNTNKLIEELKQLVDKGNEKSPQYAEMKRRFGWEWNGVRLHEYYFENLGGKERLPANSRLYRELEEQFGTFEAWKKDFIATGAMRGIGWAILYHDPGTNRYMNVWINEHNENHLAGAHPLLIMDVFEHAFISDYGTDKATYITNFFKAINWDAVTSRLP